MRGSSTPKAGLPPDTPRKRLSMSFKVANKVILDNVSDEDDDNDNNGNKDNTSVSVEQQQKQKLTDEQLSELYKREIKLCTEKVFFNFFKFSYTHTVHT